MNSGATRISRSPAELLRMAAKQRVQAATLLAAIHENIDADDDVIARAARLAAFHSTLAAELVIVSAEPEPRQST